MGSLSESEIARLPSKKLIFYLNVLVNVMVDDTEVNEESRIRQILEILNRRDDLTPLDLIQRNFDEAGYYSIIRSRRSPSEERAWNDAVIERELSCLLHAQRQAEQISNFDSVYKCQIYTNIGNALSYLGRFVDALFYWRQVTNLDPQFGMAIGNLGLGAFYYAPYIPSVHTRILFFQMAYQQMKMSMNLELESSARVLFQEKIRVLEKQFDRKTLENERHFKASYEVSSQEEREYRLWCLSNTLFLNPVNDLGAFPVAAEDDLYLPSIVMSIDNVGPKYHGLYNEMKQQFVSARWFAYAGIHTECLHYSDRQVALTDTLDYTAHGIGVQYILSAFRSAYSIFDKIGFFLNEYMYLGIARSGVSFKKIWYKNGALRREFNDKLNLPFRALLWLSKDVDEHFTEALDPDFIRLGQIRNHLEHKHLKVRSLSLTGPDSNTMFDDDLAYSISKSDLETLTVKLLRLVRSALIYLVFGVHVEEHRRRPEGEVVRLPLHRFDDKWKT